MMTVQRGQIWRWIFALVVVLGSASLLQYCGAFPSGNLKTIRVVRLPASGMPTVSDLDDLRDSMVIKHETVLKITLEGDADWIERVRSKELNTYPIASPCNLSDHEIFALGPYVGTIKASYGSQGFDQLHPVASRILYDVYIPDTGSYRSTTDFNKPMPSYSLAGSTADLCLRFAGGSMAFAYAKTNQVRIQIGQSAN